MFVRPRLASSARFPVYLLATLAILSNPASARANFVAVNFDTTPALPLASSTYSSTTAAVNIAGIGSFGGGTLVGNPTGLASFGPGGGAGNAYGTASFAGSAFANSLTFTAASGVTVSNVTGTLFNGETDLVTYRVAAYNGLVLLASAQFADVGDSTDPTGYRNFSLSGVANQGITRLVITADTTFTGGGFDFFLDNVGITYNPSTVPEPASAGLVTLGVVLAWIARRRVPQGRWVSRESWSTDQTCSGPLGSGRNLISNR